MFLFFCHRLLCIVGCLDVQPVMQCYFVKTHMLVVWIYKCKKKMDKNEIDWNKVITSNRDVYEDSGKLFDFFRVPPWLTVCLRTRLSKDGNPAFVQFELYMVQLCFRKFITNEMIFVIIDNENSIVSKQFLF